MTTSIAERLGRAPCLVAAVGIMLGLVGCSTEPATEPAGAATADSSTDRRYLLERVGEAAVAQLYADGFENRPLHERVLMWHLSEAAIAGRDIYYDQRSRYALEMRETLEAILTHAEQVPAETLEALTRYTKLFWLNSGPYQAHTSQKFLLPLTPAALAEAAERAEQAGATFPVAAGETLEALLNRLAPMFFDPSFAPAVTRKTPEAGRDILSASFNNLYAGVSMADLQGFSERYGLNSRLVRRDGRLLEEVYRVGGRYDPQIRAIVGHLDAAIPFATEPMARALRALITWYRTGESADRRAYDIAWVEDRDSPVDTINGFTEVYLDPRGVKGAWEALVFYVNQEKTEAIGRLAREAQWFEDRMPWDPRFRKAGVTGITANAIDVVIEMGDAGPLTPIGINLPNDPLVRERHGSKSISLSNVLDAYEQSEVPGFRAEFSWSPDEAARSERWGRVAGELTTNMHEVIGHASGQIDPRLGGRPEAALQEYFSALEEGRADLVALYFIADPKMVELGLVAADTHEDLVLAAYEGYARNGLAQLRRVPTGTQIEEDHMRNRQMIVHWLMAKTNAVERRERDGKTYYVLTDAAAFRDGVGRLLGEVQRIKSEGDLAAARALFDAHGIHFDPALRDQVVARVAALDLPSYTGFVMPHLDAVPAADGTIGDVRISAPLDLTAQMLDYAARTRETREAFLEAERARR